MRAGWLLRQVVRFRSFHENRCNENSVTPLTLYGCVHPP